MCGIFGYVGNPDIMTVVTLAVESSRRGPHSFGWAWSKGVVRKVGNLADSAVEVPEADWCIGHARLATSGDYRDLRNNHPIVNQGVALVHNGNVYAYREIYQRLGYRAVTDNDSEALIALYLHDPNWQQAWLTVSQSSPLAAILRTNEATYVARAGHPLYQATIQGCLYLCSRPFHPACTLVEQGITRL